MCYIQAAIMIATAVYGAYTTKENARKQEKAYRQAQKIQEDQINDQSSVKADARMRTARAERARLRAASAESGVSGLSIDDILTNVDFQSGMDIANITSNNTNSVNASRAQLQSSLNGIEQPDYIGTAINTGMQIYGAGQAGGGR